MLCLTKLPSAYVIGNEIIIVYLLWLSVVTKTRIYSTRQHTIDDTIYNDVEIIHCVSIDSGQSCLEHISFTPYVKVTHKM